MLKNFSAQIMPEGFFLEEEIEKQRGLLFSNQMKIKENRLPVMVIFEGWGAAGKGSIIGKVIKDIDPRFFRVTNLSKITEEDRRYPFLYRYMKEIPEGGQFVFYDSFWMKEVTDCVMKGKLSDDEYRNRITSINNCERSLTDNGYLILKFFINIGKKAQKKRLKELEENKNTKWRVTKDDWRENDNYEAYLDTFDRYLDDTNTGASPWCIIDTDDKKWSVYQVLSFINQGIDTALKNHGKTAPIRQNVFPLEPIPDLKDISLSDKTVTDEEYKKKLDELQDELHDLHYKLYRKRIPVIIAYEGWDAAGKGGNIKRIASALDPRGFVVQPIASPEPHEKNRHYLWRFWTRLPRDGHFSIFDRTWYGRVMVERLEGFCSENDWQRAYNEINEFEHELTEWGAVVIKFWVQIDKDTQLQRFNERKADPAKQWKITDEDWRNREKWDLYEGAINEMMKKTNTSFAPWHILESNDKHYARLKALSIVIDMCRKKIKSVK